MGNYYTNRLPQYNTTRANILVENDAIRYGENKWLSTIRRKGYNFNTKNPISIDINSKRYSLGTNYVDYNLFPVRQVHRHQNIGNEVKRVHKEVKQAIDISTSEYRNRFNYLEGAFGFQPGTLYDILSLLGFTWLPHFLAGKPLDVKEKDSIFITLISFIVSFYFNLLRSWFIINVIGNIVALTVI